MLLATILLPISVICTAGVLATGYFGGGGQIFVVFGFPLALLMVGVDLGLRNSCYEIMPVWNSERTVHLAKRVVRIFWILWVTLLILSFPYPQLMSFQAPQPKVFLLVWAWTFLGVAASTYYAFGKEAAFPKWWLKLRGQGL